MPDESQDQITVDSAVDEVAEAEVVSSSPSFDPVVPSAVDAHLDLTGTINNYIVQTENLRKEAGKFKELLDSIFANDSTYQMHDTAVKEAQKTRNATKKQLLKLPQAADLAARIQDIKAQIKEVNTSLSDYLQEYQKTTGSRQIEGLDGMIREIIYTAKLVKKNDFHP